LNDFYVDDHLSGAPTLQEALQLQRDVSLILQQAGCSLRKWASNSPDFLDTIPEELREKRREISLDQEDSVTALGLLWNTGTDQFHIKSNSNSIAEPKTRTKRNALSVVALISDFPGLLSPVVVCYKMFIQKLWQSQLQWDKPLTFPLLDEWIHLCFQIFDVAQIKIPRNVLCSNAWM
jgi:hypothetical protein